MNARIYVGILSGKVVSQGTQAEVSEYAKAHLDQRIRIVTAEAWAAESTGVKGTSAGKQAQALVASGVVPTEAMQKAIQTLSEHPRFSRYSIVKLAVQGKPLSAKQIGWLIDTAAGIKAQEKALRKLANAV